MGLNRLLTADVIVVQDSDDEVCGLYVPPAGMSVEDAENHIGDAIADVARNGDWDYDDVADALEPLGIARLSFSVMPEGL